jgi:hypothetical protein
LKLTKEGNGMGNLSKLSLTAGILTLGAVALAPLTSAIAADMPGAPPQMQGEFQPPPPTYYPPPVAQDYPPPPVGYYAPQTPPPVYYTEAALPYAVGPTPYYYGPGYWAGYGPRWGYGPGHWGHWRR